MAVEGKTSLKKSPSTLLQIHHIKKKEYGVRYSDELDGNNYASIKIGGTSGIDRGGQR